MSAASASALPLAQLPEVVRESRPVRLLRELSSRGRLAHAILMHGREPKVLETVALSVAQTLLGTHRDPRTHPDLFTLRPSKKARQIRIGQDASEPNTLRRLLRDLQQTPTAGPRKVAIVHDADRMNAATSNAFLKTLEEPPGETTILLLTHRPYDLLATIRSRCLFFRLPSEAAGIADPEWASWRDSYGAWLRELTNLGTTAPSRAHAIFGAYRLVANFVQAWTAISDRQWEEVRATQAEGLDDEEQEAMEVGARKRARSTLLAEIEEETAAVAHDLLAEGRDPMRALVSTTQELERAAGLLEVNLKEEAALEIFLLRTLRFWSRVPSLA